MACPEIQTGQRYLEAALTHIDCQAQTIGTFGYGALSDPTSTVSIALTIVLVIFVALFGIRVALGYPLGGRDLAGHAIRLVIVLTLATSWPAWRVIGYDLAIKGPAEISQVIGTSAELPGSSGDLARRLQRVDDGLAVLNERGVGRRGVSNGDWFQLGFARSAFLTGTLGPLALIRLTGGILLAIAPLIAALLLFGATRSIFSGWARGLVAIFVATIAVSLMLAVELALIEPWLEEVLRLRAANQQALGAPTEALTMTLAFALICFGAIVIAGWIAFNASLSATLFSRSEARATHFVRENQSRQTTRVLPFEQGERARLVATSVAGSIKRDARLGRSDGGSVSNTVTEPQRFQSAQVERTLAPRAVEPLGSSYRRASLRVSQPGMRRDQAG